MQYFKESDENEVLKPTYRLRPTRRRMIQVQGVNDFELAEKSSTLKRKAVFEPVLPAFITSETMPKLIVSVPYVSQK